MKHPQCGSGSADNPGRRDGLSCGSALRGLGNLARVIPAGQLGARKPAIKIPSPGGLKAPGLTRSSHLISVDPLKSQSSSQRRRHLVVAFDGGRIRKSGVENPGPNPRLLEYLIPLSSQLLQHTVRHMNNLYLRFQPSNNDSEQERWYQRYAKDVDQTWKCREHRDRKYNVS